MYESEAIVDGRPQLFREHLITSKEDAADKKTAFFKLNVVQSVNTKNYPAHNLTSVFVSGNAVQSVVKIVASLQEWMGTSVKMYQANLEGTGGTWSWQTPSANAESSTAALALQKDDYFEDQLPLSLRSLPFKEGFEKKIRLWDSFTTNKSSAPAVVESLIKVTRLDTIHCHAGGIPCWVVTVKTASGENRFWFEKKEPNILVKMETADGRKRLLYGRARWSYWDKRLPRPNILN